MRYIAATTVRSNPTNKWSERAIHGTGQEALENELNAQVHMLTVSAEPRFSLVRGCLWRLLHDSGVHSTRLLNV
jgi:hypothetical protein